MPRKNFLNPFMLTDATSMATDVTSETVDIRYLDNISVQLVFTGTPTGNFYINGSIDGTNWVALSLSSTPAAAGADGVLLLDLNQLSVPYIQVFYDRTSGTGALTVWVSGKEV